MEDKPVTLIISDLHVGGGPADKGDDHVYDRGQLKSFIDEQAASPAGRRGEVELVINGDFLEFAQVAPEVYQLASAYYWCSQGESLRKLEAIIAGHADIFEALKRFQAGGNVVTVAAGNHDVDLYWPAVQARLAEVAGGVRFETGTVWYARHGGLLQIGHGHMFDPANKFERWSDPVIPDADGGVARLEMCPGTLFMVKFVNWLEEDYPFADNLKPVTALGRILWGETRLGLALVAWMLMRFAARHPAVTAGFEEGVRALGKKLVELIEYDDEFAAEVARLYQLTRDREATVEAVRLNLDNEEAVFNFLQEMLAAVAPAVWVPVFERLNVSATLGTGGGGLTLAIKEGNKVDKEFLWKKAEQELLRDGGPQVVVMGHTHQPDERRGAHGGLYFNPGSWTRYVDYEKTPALSLEQLRDEAKFPYQLNFVRVVRGDDGRLDAEMLTYDSQG